MRRLRWWGWVAVLSLGWACDDGGGEGGGGGTPPDSTVGRIDAEVDARIIDAAPVDQRVVDAAVSDMTVIDAAPDLAVDAAPDMPPACTDASCPDGQICGDDGRCADPCVPGACPEGHCGADGRCAEGPCPDDLACGAGAYCTPAGGCADGCRTDPDDCGADRRCDRATHECVACAAEDVCGDGIDDDCDGAADEGCDCAADVPCQTGLDGDCAEGRTVCEDGEARCVAIGVDEICDSIDNDCDGATDEAWPMLGRGCPGGQGVCANRGTWQCGPEGGDPVCVGADAFAEDEACDGRDNDCDGRIDEAFAELNRPCEVGDGACAAAGRWRCTADGAGLDCDAQAGQPAGEACNSLDDDCDGAIDENFEGIGDACTLGQGQCARDGVRVCLDANRTRCDAEPGLPVGERCNNLDDDCDGRIDENPDGDGPLTQRCYEGPPGTEGVSFCQAGQQACNAGEWGACEGQVLPQPEICNGEDEDCDGRVDRTPDNQRLTVACYAGPEGSAGVGQCRAGVQTCSFGRLGACEGEVLPGGEVCDSVDNDCNGEADDVDGGCACQPGDVRDCYAGPDGTAGVGPCRAGTQRCRPDGRAWQPCEGEVLPDAERCDSVDNDCNGAIDDAIVGVGEACQAGEGACQAAGMVVCDGREIACDAEAGQAAPERCDGIDNDCDGRPDEGFNLGAVCARGVGACARDGVRACTPDGEVACDAAPGLPADDVCNQLDDDCDGQIDEDYRLGEACLSGEGVCARAGTVVCVGDGTAACDAEPGDPAVEVCNGQDDDCDGEVDDGFGLGAACAAGVGACAANGTVVCAAEGGTTCDAPVGQPADEQCNGLDDDCDGNTDELLEDLGGCNTGEAGVCAPGRLRCVDGGARCEGQVAAADEACDGLDNDCDGEVDEALGTVQCGEGICRRAIPRCQDGAPAACDPLQGAQADELCNGLDEDCDGTVDEDAIGDGAACGAGVGGCQRAGTQRCVGGRLSCDAVAGDPEAEQCNALDDDCDGAVDEETGGDLCTAGVGACRRAGARECVDGALRCPAEAGQPADEICDGEDNDCDGELDEGFAVEVCGQGICRHAVQACDGGEPVECDPFRGAQAETCNGEDDDCDGRVDEDAAGIGAPCANGVGACREGGATVCRDAQLICDAVAGEPGAEQCDSLDNDCDGVTDESPDDAGGACSRGIGACQADGVLVCAGGQLSCNAQPNPAGAEVCDGADNDCDGSTDEDQGQQNCGIGLCRRQIPRCANGAPVVCDPREGAVEETCNDQDDDCDGAFDEEASDAGGACAAGVGECRVEGAVECRNGQLVCGAQADPPGFERCDDLDNDCDGRSDEGLGLGNVCVGGAGNCAAQGQRVCDGNGNVTCDAPVGDPEDEICDGEDNDCDGSTDEGLRDLGECDTGNPGQCAIGSATCAGGRVFCLDATNPEDEVCDGIDNDCDTRTDEGFGQQVCGQGACRRVLANCDGGGAPECDPFEGAQAETCNGIDDDCDGTVDEDAAGVGAVCNAGQGACEAVGLRQCVDGALICDAEPGDPQAELCNATDDDCDGVVDEETLEAQQACSDGVGACRREAQQACVDGAVECPAQAGAPEDEICDTADNDCDGTIDEGFGVVVCGVGRCEHAVNTCDGGEPDECDPFEGAQAETCNGEDDDCDGRIDEDAAGVGVACSVGQGLCRADGQTVCQGGAIVCGAQVGDPVAERCNGLDDDCDGRTDENANDVGGACTVGQGECRANGVEACVAGRLECDADPGDPGAETCNLLDDDCDGAVDEDQGTVPCGVGACRRDLDACVDGQAPVCDPRQGAGAEACNGQDDDCDGETDEGLGQEPCGQGQCARMIDRCVDGQVNACDPFEGAVFETCDDLDNDCDGVTDEDIPTVGDACERGVGECFRQGVVECRDSQVRCSVTAGDPEVERCDSQDNDCDTRIDENAPVFPCEQGVGTCREEGFTECRDGQDVCDLNPRQPQAEQCNGVDDDCDERADEGEPDCNNNLVIDACDIVGGASQDCNQNGIPDDCDIPAGTSQDCNVNGVPDECEGGCVIDEEPPTVDLFLQGTIINMGTTIQIVVDAQDNVGVTACELFVDGQAVQLDEFCQAFVTFDDPGYFDVVGVARDAAGNQGQDQGEVRVLDPDDEQHPVVTIHTPQPGAELDNATPVVLTITDENLTRWTATWGPAEDPTINAIADGEDELNNEQVGVLDPAQIPEGQWFLLIFAEDVNGRQVTVASPFTVTECEPEAERCDGADNDCDGSTDEDFAELGDACSAGVGECRNDGVLACTQDGQGTACSVQAGQPVAEQCNALDDDCDQSTDEGFPLGQACSVGVGECARDGVLQCAADGGTECSEAPGQPQAEICDTLDNDCDGTLDEDAGCPDVNPPVVEIIIDPNPVAVGQPARITVNAVDDEGVVLRELTVDGQPIALDANGEADFVPPRAGPFDVEAAAEDEAGNRGTAEATLTALCAAHDDCPGVQVCRGGVCADGCRDDAACPLGEQCVDTECAPGCADDARCPAGQICDADQCRVGCRGDGCDPLAIIDQNPLTIPIGDDHATVVRFDGSRSDGGAGRTFRWQIGNGTVVGGGLDQPTVDVTYPGAGTETVTLTVTANGSSDVGTAQVRAIAPPSVILPPHYSTEAGVAIALDASLSVDPEGEALAFDWEVLDGPAIANLDQPGPMVDFSADTVGSYLVEVTVIAGGRTAQAQTRVTVIQPLADARPWPLELDIAPNPAEIGEDVTITLITDPQDAPPTLTLTIDGQSVALDGNNQAVMNFAEIGGYAVVGEARGEDRGARVQGDVIVFDPNQAANGAPQVSITSPDLGALVRGAVEVRGTASDADLAYYVLEVRPAGGGEFFEMARGEDSVQNGVLGTLDTTVLLPGEYTLQLRAVDARGASRSVNRPILVDEDSLPVGNLRFSLDDAFVQIAGIPITIRRTYDSFTRRQGDFGFNWTLESQVEGRIEIPNPLDEGWSFQGNCVFTANVIAHFDHNVEIVIAGRRYRFRFNPQFRACGQGFQELVVRYDPLPGTVGGLAVDGSNIVYLINNRLYDDLGLEPYDPRNFTLSTDGMSFHFRDGEIADLTGTDGAQLFYEPNGIRHSNGTRVTYERDGGGRITRLTRPDGLSRTYTYNGVGDLVRTTDFNGRAVRYFYGPGRVLERVIGPDGDVLFDGQYDQLGRLTSVLTADNQTLEREYDDGGRSVTETMPDGRQITTTYDERGRITSRRAPYGGLETYTYGADGMLESYTDTAGRTTGYVWEGGRISQMTAPSGMVIDIDRNAIGQMTRMETSTGQVFTAQYAANGAMTQVVFPGGLQYDFVVEDNTITQMTFPTGAVADLAYDGQGRPNEITAKGQTFTITRDAEGEVATVDFMSDGEAHRVEAETAADRRPSMMRTIIDGEVIFESSRETDAAGRSQSHSDGTRFQRDLAGRVTAVVRPNGTQTGYGYHPDGRLAAITSAGGRVTRFSEDVANRTRTVTLPSGRQAVRFFDEGGRLIRERAADGTEVSTGFDALSRPNRLTSEFGAETLISYDQRDLPTEFTTSTGAVATMVHDDAGRIIRQQVDGGPDETWEYTPGGDVTLHQTPQGRIKRWQYDAFGRVTQASFDGLPGAYDYTWGDESLTEISDPLDRVWRLTKERDGRRTVETIPSGLQKIVETLPDGRRRITGFDGAVTEIISVPGAALTTTRADDGTEFSVGVDVDGQIDRLIDARGVTTVGHNLDGQLTQVTSPDGAFLSVAYVPETGKIAAITTAGGAHTHQYDADNHLAGVTLPNGVVATTGFTDFGAPTGWTVGPIALTHGYDNRGQLINQTVRVGAQDVFNETTTRDQDGYPVAAVEAVSGRAVDWTYDGGSRLIEEDVGGQTTVYTYDAGWNLTNRTGPAPRAFAHDIDDRLTDSGPETFTYDDAGQLIEITGDRELTLTWDGLGRLTRAQTGGRLGVHDVTYEYDAVGLMVSRTEDGVRRRFVWDRTGRFPIIIEEQDAAGAVIARYTRLGPLLVRNAGADMRVFVGDRQGSIRHVLDAQGAVIASRDYSAYGRPTGAALTLEHAFGYTGEWTDPVTGFVFLRARHYDPEVGRFLSRDPQQPDVKRPESLNRYLYAFGSPSRLVDPSGQFSLVSISVSIAIRTTLTAMRIYRSPAFNILGALHASQRAFRTGTKKFKESGLAGFIADDPIRAIPTSSLIGYSFAASIFTHGITAGGEILFHFRGGAAGSASLYWYCGTIGGPGQLSLRGSGDAGLAWDVLMPDAYTGTFEQLSAKTGFLLAGALLHSYDLLFDFMAGSAPVFVQGMQAASALQYGGAVSRFAARLFWGGMAIAWSPSSGTTTLPDGTTKGVQTWGLTSGLSKGSFTTNKLGSAATFFGFSTTDYTLHGNLTAGALLAAYQNDSLGDLIQNGILGVVQAALGHVLSCVVTALPDALSNAFNDLSGLVIGAVSGLYNAIF